MGRLSKYLTAAGVIIAMANMAAAWIMMGNIALGERLPHSNSKIVWKVQCVEDDT